MPGRIRIASHSATLKKRDQAAKAGSEAKAKIEGRIAEIRADDERRSGKMRHAWESAKEALAALQALLIHANEEVRASAMAALHRIDPEQFPAPIAMPE